MKEYNKLVRDKIPEIIRADGKECDIRVAEGKESMNCLRRNLWKRLMSF